MARRVANRTPRPSIKVDRCRLTIQSSPVTIDFGVKAAENSRVLAISPVMVGNAASANEHPDAGVVSITVPGELAFRGLVSRAVATVCKLACSNHTESERLCNEVVSAVGEAFNNAVLHAYDSTHGDVSLTVAFDSSQIVVELAESGAAFDLEAVPDLMVDEPQESGMGLFIIRNFVDELTYTPGPPNRLRMTKRLPQF